jgi:hypothetical protein
MLLIIQFALVLAFIGLLILSLCDAIKGTLTILSGLVLIAVGYTLKGISYVIRQIHPAPAVSLVVREWNVVGASE